MTASWKDPAFKYTNITGLKFGKLVAKKHISGTHDIPGKWLCLCSCGNKTLVLAYSLKSGTTKSCGCLRKEIGLIKNKTHGRSKTMGAYSVWRHMNTRCNSPSDPFYANYGGRGIHVCERWKRFENFLADMGEKPKGMMIERKNNDGPYSPDNCVWATNKEQSRNRRSTILITARGKTQCLLDWCNELGLHYMKTRYQIKGRGISPYIALGINNG